jgi:hypothetical protein
MPKNTRGITGDDKFDRINRANTPPTINISIIRFTGIIYFVLGCLLLLAGKGIVANILLFISFLIIDKTLSKFVFNKPIINN